MEKVGYYEYNTKDLIGHGAFAIVFKGRHQKRKDHVVAIKCVPKKNLGKSQPLIGKEIKILQELTKLQHKNVVALLECVDSSKNLYIVIEYCNGGDLSEYLTAKGSLSEDTIRLFLRQIAEAMKVLNQKEVVHRDLKPQNILLCHSGKLNPAPSEITLKIADFGFARFLTEGVMAATLCGSPMYMAPEVIMSLKYDAKADLWSIGTIVYQCLTGKAPFMAPNPQQLKYFYEKNANLAPNIPSGTSKDLTDLLIRLMKRDAKDRMDVDELGAHPFLKTIPRSSSPVPVPSRRSLSPATPPSHEWEQEMGGEEMASSPISESNAYSNSEQRYSPPSPIEQDFVVIPPSFVDMNRGEVNKNSPMKHNLSDPNVSPSKIPVTNKAFKKSNAVNINISAKAAKFQAMQESDNAMQISECRVSGDRMATASPVPTQKNNYEQLKSSLQHTPPNEAFGGKISPECSPTSKMSNVSPSERSRSNSASSDPFRVTDINSFTPPSVQFTIGTPPGGGRLRSFSGSTGSNSGRQTPPSWRHQATPPHSTSPLKRSGSTPPASMSPAAYRCLDFRSSGGAGPLRANFGNVRALTLPEFHNAQWHSGLIQEAEGLGYLQRSGSSGRLCENLLNHYALSGGAAAHSPPPYHPASPRYLTGCHHCGCGSPGRPRRNSQHGSDAASPTGGHFFGQGNSPSSLEGAFIPELPEETLLAKEHNDTLAKLNFVFALVKCILELAKTRSSPLSSALSSSISQADGTDEAMSDGCRRAVQLLLYMKALQLVHSAFKLSEQEIRSGQLQKSSSVRNVLQRMKEQYHFSLSMCKSLNTPGLLQSVGVDPAASSVTTDKILYNYAIQMCQSAALEELFGQPKESFHRYQTAQILLHSLGQQIDNTQDMQILHKYRDAVQKRLEILTSTSPLYAYHSN